MTHLLSVDQNALNLHHWSYEDCVEIARKKAATHKVALDLEIDNLLICHVRADGKVTTYL